MAALPPEYPDLQPEANPAEPAVPAEPRLLTRRDADDADESVAAREHQDHARSLRHLPARLRQRHTRHLRTLDALRARIANGARIANARAAAPAAAASRRAITQGTTSTRSLRLFARSLVALLTLLVVSLAAFVLFLRHDMTAALPQVDGDLHLAGLTAPVTVLRDELGVPALQAATLNDLVFAQGFVTAQDRLWQMDALRRHGTGELAEILGPSLVEHDRQQRILQLRAAADRAVLALPADQLAELQAYARGVNTFIESHADTLPVEFHLLHYTPAPWTPRDSLLVSLVMFQDLATSYPTKLRREVFSAHLEPELVADLYPDRTWRDQPPTQPQPDLTTPKPDILQIPLDHSQVKLHLPAGLLPADGSARCPECRAGSNNWAVSGQHTASGKPMVSNDMHLGLSLPDIWYQAGLHIAASAGQPAFDVTGFTLPGTPFVIVGRNQHVAWSFTNLGADVQDVHVEHLRGSGDNTEFEQADGSWAPVVHHRELIRVRGGRNRTLDVLTTTARIGSTEVATPIISPLYKGEQRALSLLWTAYDPHNLSEPFYAVNAAATGSALVASFANFGGPSLNLVYADDAGHIGYHALGRIPVRGPADRHPRTPIELPAPNSNPLPDQPAGPADDEDTQPQAFMSAAPHLVEAAFVRHRRAERPALERSTPARRRRRAPEPAADPVPKQPEAEIPAVTPARDYVIGSPIPDVPVAATDRSVQWSGYIPFEELPAIVDPADGVLATANARITPDDYPYFVSDEWAPSFRTERIRKLLAGRSSLVPADMLRLEMDTTSAFDRMLGERLAYALDHASGTALKGHDGKRLRAAADLLRGWDGNMAVESAPAAMVAAVKGRLWPLLLRQHIAEHDHVAPGDRSVDELLALYEWGNATSALETLLTLQPARWLPHGYANWNDFLAAATASALSQAGAPRDLDRWKYGLLHQVDIEHPVFALSPLLGRLLGVQAGTGPQPIGGDGTTILATARSFGPSERFTADLGDAGATTGNVTAGESGNPRSPHYLDQFPAWLHGATFAMPLAGKPAQHTLRLLP